MQLQTKVEIPKADFNFTHLDSLVSIGSCFADCIGDKLLSSKFSILSNPFGTIFNPLAISNLILNSINNTPNFNLVSSNQIWQTYECHSELGQKDKSVLIDNLKNLNNLLSCQLQKAKVLIITLGTALIYHHKELEITVANCHKMPSSLFNKQMLTAEEITKQLSLAFTKLREINPEIKIILTVSPVRHTKDTLPLNSVSKAILRTACFELENSHSFIYYFPAYEIMMDELRDYRFFKDDMIHPSTLAENYIWQQFLNTYCDDKTISIINQWQKIKKDLEHKPHFPASDQYQKHLNNTLLKLQELNTEIDLSAEITKTKETIKFLQLK